MSYSILVPLSDSPTSHSVLHYITHMPISAEDTDITLLNVYKEPAASQDLMGKSFVEKQKSRMSRFLDGVKDNLAEAGFDPDKIHIVLLKDHYPTVTDGIVAEFNRGNYDMVIIGRKHMSKAEEFVMGDISIKLVRMLENTAILIVKQTGSKAQEQ